MQTKNKLVTVVTPCYNAAMQIGQTIESVQNQTYTNWEMVIVDDCSQDDSVQKIQERMKDDSRIKLIQCKQNGGVAVARNEAMKAANGAYVAFLDSDDLWHPQKLEKQIRFMEQGDIAFSFTSYQYIDEQGELMKTCIRAPKCIGWKEGIKNTIIGCLTVVVDIEKTEKFYMPELSHSEDHFAWLELNRKGFDAYGLDEVLAYYRVVGQSLSGNKLKAIVSQWNNYRDILHIPFIPRCYYWICYIINAIKKRIG